MIIDTHTHIFPDHICSNRENYFEGEPEFKLLYQSPKSKMAGAGDLIRAMDIFGVDLSIVCGFPWRSPELARAGNDYIIESVRRYPDRLKGLACFDALWTGAADETRRCINSGLIGVGELAFYLSGIDSIALKSLQPVMEVLLSHGNLPCMIHTNEPIGHPYPGKTPVTLDQIYRLAGTFPENRVILAHWGGGIFFYNVMKKEVKQTFENIWFDTAASPYLYDPAVYAVAEKAGMIDKILFGTDYPLLTPDRYFNDLSVSGLSKENRDKICFNNIRKAYL